jgi:hypothetical protein
MQRINRDEPTFCCISQGAKASAVLANDNQSDQIIEKILPIFGKKVKTNA